MTLALLTLLACGSDTPPPQAGNVAHIATDISAYPAHETAGAALPSGVHGVVKLTSEHSFLDEDGLVASYTAQGTGTLWVDGGEWFVVTARHVVVPNTKTESVGDVELGPLQSVGSRIAISSLGLRPLGVVFSESDDVALLAVDPDDHGLLRGILNVDSAAPIRPGRSDMASPGQTVEAWGFPAKHQPQVEKPAVSAVNSEYLVLNRALLRGYSGGPVLVADAGRKSVVGLTSRADDQAQQTTVLTWDAVTSLRTGGGVSLPVPGETMFGGVRVVAPERGGLQLVVQEDDSAPSDE